MFNQEFPKLRGASYKPPLQPSSAMKPPPAGAKIQHPEPFLDKLKQTVLNVLSTNQLLPQQVSSSSSSLDYIIPTPPSYALQANYDPSLDRSLIPPVTMFDMSRLNSTSTFPI